MNQALLLPWFPILLGVGVGGRLLGQARGFGLGVLAALFWIVLVQAQAGTGIWRDPWQVGALACGGMVLVMMGGWSGQSQSKAGEARSCEGGQATQAPQDPADGWRLITAATEQFDDWLARHENDRNPWPEFGEFVRGVLYECCQATHVKCFRFSEATQELKCLDESDDFVQSVNDSMDHGVVGRVFASGKSFVADSDRQPPAELAGAKDPGASWCFPIERGTARIGVVSVGQLGPNRPSRAFITAVERLIGVFWLYLTEVNINRVAGDEDPVSGLLNRPTFLRAADAALRESYEQGEPVALAVVGVQGLRQLNDSGRWEVADELVHEIGLAMQGKARMDDRIGRFDGSRFIWLLRRVDSELAALILKHVITRLEQVCSDRRWGVPAAVYCGLTGSRTGKPDLRRLVSTALQQSQRARLARISLATDLEDSAAGATVPAGAGAS
jgi:GGDEF domain-containing protein